MFRIVGRWRSAFEAGFQLGLASYKFSFTHTSVLLYAALGMIVTVVTIGSIIFVMTVAGLPLIPLINRPIFVLLELALTLYVNRILDKNSKPLLTSFAYGHKKFGIILLWVVLNILIDFLVFNLQVATFQWLLLTVWQIASLFAIPLIADGQTGILKIIGKSIILVKNNIGKIIGGAAALGLVNFFASRAVQEYFPFTGIPSSLVIPVFYAKLISTITIIFIAITYRYVERKSIEPFTPNNE